MNSKTNISAVIQAPATADLQKQLQKIIETCLYQHDVEAIEGAIGSLPLFSDPHSWHPASNSKQNMSTVGSQGSTGDAVLKERLANSHDAMVMSRIQHLASPDQLAVMGHPPHEAFDLAEAHYKQVYPNTPLAQHTDGAYVGVVIQNSGEQGVKCPTVGIFDHGIGVEKDKMIPVFTSAGNSQKGKDALALNLGIDPKLISTQYLMGKKGLGSWGAFAHCQNGAYVITVSRPMGQKEWAILICRKHPIDLHDPEAEEYIEYFAPFGCVPLFDSPLLVIAEPSLKEHKRLAISQGTLVRLVEFNMSAHKHVNTNANQIKQVIALRLPQWSLPTKIFSCETYRSEASKYATPVVGFANYLNVHFAKFQGQLSLNKYDTWPPKTGAGRDESPIHPEHFLTETISFTYLYRGVPFTGKLYLWWLDIEGHGEIRRFDRQLYEYKGDLNLAIGHRGNAHEVCRIEHFFSGVGQAAFKSVSSEMMAYADLTGFAEYFLTRIFQSSRSGMMYTQDSLDLQRAIYEALSTSTLISKAKKIKELRKKNTQSQQTEQAKQLQTQKGTATAEHVLKRHALEQARREFLNHKALHHVEGTRPDLSGDFPAQLSPTGSLEVPPEAIETAGAGNGIGLKAQSHIETQNGELIDTMSPSAETASEQMGQTPIPNITGALVQSGTIASNCAATTDSVAPGHSTPSKSPGSTSPKLTKNSSGPSKNLPPKKFSQPKGASKGKGKTSNKGKGSTSTTASAKGNSSTQSAGAASAVSAGTAVFVPQPVSISGAATPEPVLATWAQLHQNEWKTPNILSANSCTVLVAQNSDGKSLTPVGLIPDADFEAPKFILTEAGVYSDSLKLIANFDTSEIDVQSVEVCAQVPNTAKVHIKLMDSALVKMKDYRTIWVKGHWVSQPKNSLTTGTSTRHTSQKVIPLEGRCVILKESPKTLSTNEDSPWVLARANALFEQQKEGLLEHLENFDVEYIGYTNGTFVDVPMKTAPEFLDFNGKFLLPVQHNDTVKCYVNLNHPDVVRLLNEFDSSTSKHQDESFAMHLLLQLVKYLTSTFGCLIISNERKKAHYLQTSPNELAPNFNPREEAITQLAIDGQSLQSLCLQLDETRHLINLYPHKLGALKKLYENEWPATQQHYKKWCKLNTTSQAPANGTNLITTVHQQPSLTPSTTSPNKTDPIQMAYTKTQAPETLSGAHDSSTGALL